MTVLILVIKSEVVDLRFVNELVTTFMTIIGNSRTSFDDSISVKVVKLSGHESTDDEEISCRHTGDDAQRISRRILPKK